MLLITSWKEKNPFNLFQFKSVKIKCQHSVDNLSIYHVKNVDKI